MNARFEILRQLFVALSKGGALRGTPNRHYFPVPRLASVMLIAMALVSFTLCGCQKTEIGKAAYEGNLETVKAMLKADPKLASDRDGSLVTPLHWAAQMNHKEVAELLLANGAEVDARDDFGNTPLHFAATQGNTDIVALLLAHGAQVNAVPKIIADTPLKMATDGGHQDTAELLRQHGGR